MNCRLYTAGRTHQIMVGKIGDIPVPAAQWWQPIALLLAGVALWVCHDAWFLLPWPFRIATLLGVLAGAWYGAGRFRSNPFAAVAAVASHLTDRYSPRPRPDRRRNRLHLVVPVVETPKDL